MIVKGIIKSIDVQGNTCVVRMPYFETAGNDEIIATATVSNSPGSYNGYKVDDVVWVAFENDQLECPVVIGKLYLGIEAERADPRGTLNVVDSKVSRTAEIPFDTKLGRNLEPGMPKTLAPYNSLNSIANNLSTAEVNIAQNDREYGNRFSVAFENIEGNRSSINQTANELSTEISDRKKADTSLDTKITQTATDITNEVAATYVTQDGKSTSEAFGWSLKKDKWEVYKKINDKPTPILVADKEGLEVNGKIEAESGHIGKFIISDVHNCVIKDSEGNDTGKTFEASGIHSDDYITKFDDAATKRGVYVGTDGIKVGSNFSVDTSGVVTATKLVLKPENVYLEDEYETDPNTGTQRRKNLKKRIEDGDTATETLKEILNQNLANGEDITSTKITNEVMLSPYLIVDAANIRKTLTIGDIDAPLFHADIDDPTVTIGGFKVGSTGISSDTDTAKYNTSFGDSAVGDSGVYVGTDGIRLGKNFSVDNEGNVVASSLKIQPTQVDGLGELALKDSLSAGDVGARPDTWTPTASDVGARPDSWTPSASDVGARPNTWTPSASDVGAVATGDLTNSSSTAYSNIVSIANGCITAASIDAGKITSGSLTIDNKFIADIDRSTVKIGSFDVDGNSLSMGLYDENGDFIGDGQSAADTPLGKTGSLIVCAAGSSTKARIGGSTFVNGWHYTAGRNFGVRTDPTTKESELYASRGKIGNWNILPRTALCESINGIPDYGYTDPERGNEKTNLVFLYSGSKYKTYDAVSEALTDGFNLGRPDSFEPGCLTVGGNWISPDQNCDFYNNYSYTQLRGGKLGGVQFGVTNLYKGQDYEIYCPMLALWDLGAKDVAQIGNPDIHGEYARDEKYKGSGIALLRHGYVPGDVLTGGTESTWFLCGSWVAESAISIISDRRKKEDIKELNDQYDSLFDQLKPTTFKYKNGNSGRLHTGFIAQDIEEALKKSNLKTTEFAGLVIRNHNYFDDKLQKEQQSTEYSLRYEEFVALNTNQIQKLKTKVKSLEDKIAELEELLKTK